MKFSLVACALLASSAAAFAPSAVEVGFHLRHIDHKIRTVLVMITLKFALLYVRCFSHPPHSRVVVDLPHVK